MNPIERTDPPILRHDAPDPATSAAAPAFQVGVAMLDPRRPVTDPALLQLVRDRAPRIDEGLAPLVAAGMVHRDIARIVCADLRVALLESSGPEAGAAMSLPRTIKAIAIMDLEAKQIGGA